MCLGPEFFDLREETLRTREAIGEMEIEHFMRSKRLRFDLLYELGYFELRLGPMSTADFFIHHIARSAKKYFTEDRDLQLIFVKAQKAVELDSYLRKRVPSPSPASKGGNKASPRSSEQV
jgi:hypothetical protein